MPNGKRTERISERDLEVLEFIARYGVVPREAVALWAQTRRASTLGRERRLRESRLIEVLPALGGQGRVAICTRLGLEACGRPDLRTARFAPGQLIHSCIAAYVGAEIELAGAEVLTEREVLARERCELRREFTASVARGGLHRPDLVRLGESVEVIEVELTMKGSERLDSLVRAWSDAVILKQVSRVLYVCPPRVLRAVKRALARTHSARHIAADPLVLPQSPLGPPPDLLAHIAADKARQSRAGGPTPGRGLTAAPTPLPSRVGRGG